MNKQHWNTLVFDESFGDDAAMQWVTDSYDLVVSSLPKKLRAELHEMP
jgi:predicted DNA-binding protein (MmcQ/YjbR family)